MALPWDELKRIMTEEFCPRNEMKKLEAEFWDLTQDSGESLAYTNRFHELSMLVPHMVTPLSRCIEKYIGGLPRQIQDTVLGRNPANLEDAIRLAATLTDNHVKAGTLTKKGAKKVSDTTTPPTHVKEVQNEQHRNTRKRKAKNFAIVTPAAPNNQVAPLAQNPAKKAYGGTYPLCNNCNYHHPQTVPCRLCNHCGKLGHTANICRQKALATQANPVNQPGANQVVPINANGRACYECGNPNHFRNQCPKLVNNNQGGAPDKSFVSLNFEPLLAKTRSKLKKTFTVEVADGNTITIDSIIHDCSLELNGHTFPVNLIPMPLGSFDVIIGMDWLSKNHAEVMCFEKYIRVPLPSGDILKVFGEKPCKGLKLMSCITAQRYIRKKCMVFLAHVIQKEDKERRIEDIPIIREFPEVFPDDLPGLPLVREVKFRIDLIPGANTVAKAPYRLAPSELQELASSGEA
ncbi:hypothetical protein L1987_54659 [Smallanthus sonchifolius]|uniref:Uncharacterized protein n=1 Tax=Smallanthus sonchifolius TaxID=185202 RepID=A0ACB9E7T5_9ASTR|nr:hypothetical protein L1987_54659 [Smallanthus sonchifolius]